MHKHTPTYLQTQHAKLDTETRPNPPKNAPYFRSTISSP